MSRHPNPLSIPMSQIISSDAPLLSPVTASESNWDSYYSPNSESNFSFSYYQIPPSPPSSEGSTVVDSPVPPSRMLKMHSTMDSNSEHELCLPTHQVFDFPESMHTMPQSPPSSPSLPRLSISISRANGTAPSVKRSASPSPFVAKKPRADLEGAEQERLAAQELISRSKSTRSSKDFVPPDVSGLSKREARLVKNRAAAFLSRQRKREEFELMEVRVGELEEENARLLSMAMASNGGCSRPQDHELASEVEQLRAQLAAAEERERTLNAKLEKSSDSGFSVKSEPLPTLLSSVPCSPTSRPQFKSSGASLGLMVLLCALPALLSMPTHSIPSTNFSFPMNPAIPVPSFAFDYGSISLPISNEYDWSRSAVAMMDTDMDLDEMGVVSNAESATATTKIMEFADSLNLGGLDISFEASPSEDGRKIRVKIHPSSTATETRAGSPSFSDSTSSSSELDMWAGGADGSPAFDAAFSATSSNANSGGDGVYAYASQPPPSSANAGYAGDPFLGVGNRNGFEYGVADAMLMQGDFDQQLDYGFDGGVPASEYGGGASSSSSANFNGVNASPGRRQRRVRIALKSAPAPGGEGGEWEVQFC